MKRIATLLILLLIVVNFSIACNSSSGAKTQTLKSPEAKIGDKLICPVMNSKFEVKEDTLYTEIDGKKYYVCCKGCIEPLKTNPKKYLK